MGKWLTRLPRLLLAQLRLTKYSAIITDVYVPQRPEISPTPRWEDGKMADLHNSTLIFRFGSIDFWFSGICTYLKFSHRPMGDPRFACWLQGGGVLVEGGTVTIDSCTISGNTAVRAHVRKFPSSDGKMADVLAPTHACTTVNASVNYSGYVPQRPCKFPMGDSRFARCLQGGGVYVSSGTVTITSSSINGNTARYVHAFCSKVPIAPMRRLFTCLPRLSLGNCGRRSCQQQDVSATETSIFPIAPMGDSRFARCCRAAVSVSRGAQCPS